MIETIKNILTLRGSKYKKDIIVAIGPGIYHRIKVIINNFLAKIDRRITENWNEYARGAHDNTLDKAMIHYEEVAGSEEIELPEKFIIENDNISDQGRTMLCVAFGSTEGSNNSNFLYKKPTAHDHNETANYIEANYDPNIRKNGTLIINGPKALKAMGKIDSYFQVGISRFKEVLYQGCTIQSGTNKLNWNKTGKNAVAVLGAGGGHHADIVGWHDTLTLSDGYGKVYTGFWIIENTWGERWGKKGIYFLPYELADQVLFNVKVAMVTDRSELVKRNKELAENIDKKLEEIKKPSIQVAIENGFISDRDLDKPITRMEAGIISGRMWRKIEQEFKKK